MGKDTFRVLCVFFLLTGFLTTPATATVLWDNGPLVTCQNCGTDGADVSIDESLSLGMASLGFLNSISTGTLLAEDFTVDGGVWDVSRITFFLYQTGSPTATTINDLRYQVWDGSPDDPASSVVFGGLVNSISGSDWTNIYRVTEGDNTSTMRPVMRVFSELEPGTLLLSPGTYWVVWQTGGNGGLSGPWAPPISITGEATTGNALIFFGGAWINVEDINLATSQGIPFVIEGSKVANFNFGTGIVNIPIVTIDGSPKRYQVEMERIPGTLDFSVTDSNKLP